jgi:hypothetical protein
VYDPRHFINFKTHIKFINAEWGVEIDLMPSETTFKELLQTNLQKTGEAVLTFRDVSSLLINKFQLKGDDRKMIRFLDADNLKLVTMSGFVIFRPSE